MHRFKGSNLIVPLCVAANAGWWITQDFGVQLHGFGKRSAFDLLVVLYAGRHSYSGTKQMNNEE